MEDGYGAPFNPNTTLSSNPAKTLGLSDALQTIKDAAGIISKTENFSNPPSLPWTVSESVISSSFFKAIEIDHTRWNQLFPYRLLVIDSKDNSVVNGKYTKDIEIKAYQQGTSIIAVTDTGPVNSLGQWEMALPIAPQQLSIVDQYAINTSATLRGVLEEHNGLKFKTISASGTMGVWPFRQNLTKPPGSPNILQSVFGGTLSGIGSLTKQAIQTYNTFTSNHPASKPTTINPPESTAGISSTGYFQALYLQQFLEQYAEAKRNPRNASWRLVFDIPKQNTSYVVTPLQFTWQQNVNKPMEIAYQLQFKAWRRIDLKQKTVEAPAEPYTITPGILQRVLNTINQARLTMSSAIALIGAVRSDVDNIFSLISQTSLFIKEARGVAATASDLPSSITKDFKSAIQEWVANNTSAALDGVTTAAGAAAVMAIKDASQKRDGITEQAASNGQLGNKTASSQAINPAASIFNNTNANIDLLDQVPLDQLNLNTAQQNKLNNLLSNVNLTTSQLKSNAQTIQTLANQLADYFGAGSSLYNSIYNLTPPKTRIQPMTINEFLLLDTLYEFVQSINILTATDQIKNQNIQNSLDYVAGLANQSGIDFTVPNSKIIVPVPANTTIEGIASRYLGDPNRWLEIATLNKLEQPYIDYDGFQLPLLSNAVGRQVMVSSNEHLYLGQAITLKAAGQVQVSRKITDITTLPNNSGYLLTLDGDSFDSNGDPALKNFTLANNAYVQAYLPNTVNAMQKIYIPSALSPAQLQNQVNVPLPQTVTISGDPLAQISGVDWLVDDSGDIVLDAYGNFQLSYGMTNIIQALKILFSTTVNTFMIHPEYGLGVSPGTSISNINIQDLYKQINNQIQSDPRFSGVTGLQITANPPNLSISVGVQVAGQTGIFPVSFDLAAA